MVWCAAHGFPLFYYSSREHGEVDFIVERMGKVLPVEVKSGKHYQRHRGLNRMMDVPDYAIPEAVVLDDAVHKVESGVHYAPVYMAMFLEHETLPEKMPGKPGDCPHSRQGWIRPRLTASETASARVETSRRV